jgi:hypothetical protein
VTVTVLRVWITTRGANRKMNAENVAMGKLLALMFVYAIVR